MMGPPMNSMPGFVRAGGRHTGMVRVLQSLPAILTLIIGWGAASASGSGLTDAQPITHPLFDANHCLRRIERLVDKGTVVLHWNCGKDKLITMSCVYDRTGYGGLGPQFARPGWHCNYPLPVLADDRGERASDVAVGDVSGPASWAACFVASYGDFSSRHKPYHRTPCWRALRKIGRAVRRDGRSPAEVARDLLP